MSITSVVLYFALVYVISSVPDLSGKRHFFEVLWFIGTSGGGITLVSDFVL